MNTKNKIGAGITAIYRNTFLVGLRSHLGSEPNTWSLVGGKYDESLDKTLNDTASREFFEETGIFISPNDIIPYCIYSDELNKFKFVNFYYKFDNKPKIEKWDKSENVRFEWVRISDMKSNLYKRHYGLTYVLPKLEKLLYPTNYATDENHEGYKNIYDTKDIFGVKFR